MTGWWFILWLWVPLYSDMLRKSVITPLLGILGAKEAALWFGQTADGFFVTALITLALVSLYIILGMKTYARIQKIHALVHPQVLEQMRLREPVTGMQSKFSPYHAIAVTLLDGAALPAQFADERALAPDVTALRQKVTVQTDAGVRKDETRMTITLDSGETCVSHIEHARGYSPDNPPSDAELQTKFHALAVPCLGEQQSRELSERIWALENEKSVRSLMQLCSPATQA